jgi:MerR family transcriptional regulator, copper efflux regulator
LKAYRAGVTTYRVSQLAERVGLPPSTLRFYEQAGLLPARRSGSGYRLFDHQSVERIEVITTGKRLGLPLEEIGDLLHAWENGLCRDVRERLRPMVLHQIAKAERHAAETGAFIERLRKASSLMDGPVPPGRCGPGCGLVPHQDLAATGLTCTLTAAGQADRAEEWRRLLSQADAREHAGGRLTFRLPARLASRVAELAADEQQCCVFLEFTLHLAAGELRFEVHAPEGAAPMLADLFSMRDTPLRSWPLFDPRREQVDDLRDAGRAHVRPAFGRIDPAKVGPAVELRQRVEERPGGRVGRERRGDVVSEIAALGTFRCQLNCHLSAGLPPGTQGQHPSGAARLKPSADPPAVDGAGDGMLGLGAPCLIRVKRHGDDRATFRIGGDDGAEPLRAHDPHGGTNATMESGRCATLGRTPDAIVDVVGLADCGDSTDSVRVSPVCQGSPPRAGPRILGQRHITAHPLCAIGAIVRIRGEGNTTQARLIIGQRWVYDAADAAPPPANPISEQAARTGNRPGFMFHPPETRMTVIGNDDMSTISASIPHGLACMRSATHVLDVRFTARLHGVEVQ